MTHLRLRLFILLFSLADLSATAQQLVKKRQFKDGITTQYFVLKENKDIRQGGSFSTFKDIFGTTNVIELGEYDHNKRSGKWLSFYQRDPANSLQSVGYYTNDQKEGDWKYFYRGKTGQSVLALVGAIKRTSILETDKKDQMFSVAFDSAGQQVSCSGKYHADKRVGIWNYYSPSGLLFHRYDHDSKTIVDELVIENDFMVFLGGEDRFKAYYYNSLSEHILKPMLSTTSEVKFEIGRNGEYRLVSSSGDPSYKEYIAIVLKSIPKDWVVIKVQTTKRYQITSKAEIKEDTNPRYKASMELKVVE